MAIMPFSLTHEQKSQKGYKMNNDRECLYGFYDKHVLSIIIISLW